MTFRAEDESTGRRLEGITNLRYTLRCQNNDAGLLLFGPALKIADSKTSSSGLIPGVVLANAQARFERGFCLMPRYKRIALDRGHVALVDEADYERINHFRWRVFRPRKARTSYAIRSLSRGGSVRMHREILGFGPGDPPIDHRNHDGLDNRRQNLRPCTYGQNQVNSKPRNGRRFKGVYRHSPHWRKKRFQAHITVANKRISLGYFLTEREAARAYDIAARKHFGDFAKLNLPQKRTP